MQSKATPGTPRVAVPAILGRAQFCHKIVQSCDKIMFLEILDLEWNFANPKISRDPSGRFPDIEVHTVSVLLAEVDLMWTSIEGGPNC